MTKAYLDKIIQFMTAAFGLAAGLAWNSAIQDLIGTYIQPGDGIVGKFIYAVILTFIAVIVTVYLSKAYERISKKEEQAAEKRAAELCKKK
jgi:hypothetical protein